MKLSVGDQAPDFEAQNQNGETIRLSNLRGKKIVLYFYPKDNTPGCTAQACNLRDNYDQLLQQGYEIIGISTDSVKSHNNFASKHELPFTLVADPDKKIVEDYGVWQEKSMYGRKYMGTMRYTFVIDENGIIQDIITKVKTKEHAKQLLA